MAIFHLAPQRPWGRMRHATKCAVVLRLVLAAASLQLGCGAAVRARADDMSSRKIDDLLAAMTIEEKVGQLTLLSSDHASTGPYATADLSNAILRGEVGGVFNVSEVQYTRSLQQAAVERTRLGIPLLLGADVLHGYRTIFPVPLGQAASFDLVAIRGAERIAAREAAASGINWVFAPMLDVARDPRWGRIVEGSGESAWLGAKIGAARIAGFQGERLDANDAVAACAKHLGANSAVEGGRDYSAVELSERVMRELYLPPFRAAARSGVACFMAAFNTYEGVPGVANGTLLNGVLRHEWGFPGIVVSDFGAIDELVVHGIVDDGAAAAQRALLAGTDIDMQSGAFRRNLPRLVRDGQVPVAALDASVRRVLALKAALGLFRDPYARMDPRREAATLLAPEHRAAALALAEKSLVLVKNDRETLPFSRDVHRIAVLGPRADARADMMGPWSADGVPADAVTLADGIRAILPQAAISVVPAGATDVASVAAIADAVAAAKAADVVVLALGEKAVQSGEAASRADPSLPADQLDLAQAVLALGKPTAVVLFHGRPLVLTPLEHQADALLLAWFPGTMGGAAIARTLFGENEPRGRLPVTWPRSVGQIPLYHDHLPTGRPATEPSKPYTTGYLDQSAGPLFPFGFGLSYTSFAFAPPRLDRDSMGPGEKVTVSVDVTNTGQRRGTALVELYVRQPVAEISRPVLEFRGFQSVELAPGATGTADIELSDADLAYWHTDNGLKTDPGRFVVMTGPDAGTLQSVSLERRP